MAEYHFDPFFNTTFREDSPDESLVEISDDLAANGE